MNRQTDVEEWDVRFVPTDDPAWQEVRGSHGQLVCKLQTEMPMLAVETMWHGQRMRTKIPIQRVLRHMGLRIERIET